MDPFIFWPIIVLVLMFVLVFTVPTEVGIPLGFVLVFGSIAFMFLYTKFSKLKKRRIFIKDKRVSEYTVFSENGSSTREKYQSCSVDFVYEGRKFVHTRHCIGYLYKKLHIGKTYTVYMNSTEIRFIVPSKNTKK